MRVAVAAPLVELFDYLPPEQRRPHGEAPLLPGMRVLVPFGRSRRVGIVAGVASKTSQPTERLKQVLAALDERPLLDSRDLEFVLWAARYYRCSPGEALFTALPARLRRPDPLVDPAPAGWRVTALGEATAPDALRRAPRQAQVLAELRARPEGIDDDGLRDGLGYCSAALRALADKGLIARCRLSGPVEEPPPAAAPDEPPMLNEAQQAAVDAVRSSSGFGCFLLDGVTGSGKTEVYLRLIDDALARGRQALVLVPEIGLTPQLRQRFERRLRVPMAVLHSALGEREREFAWQRAARGSARLVIGTRSAIFTPLPDLGLVIVDEEHDLSLKQQDGFRYSARDLAVRRAQLADCAVVLGSATPSLESLHNTRTGRYRRLELPERAGTSTPPRILLADIRAQPLETGISHALMTRAEHEIAAGNQVLLFLNRRGFSPVLTCHDCGWVSDCRHCDAQMTVHRGQHRLVCHHCGDARPIPVQCPYCESPDLRPLGQGTERVEQTLRKRFPGVPLARIDRDSTRRKGELERLLADAERGDYRILLGTQMLAKGHHLPGITLVGILDLDHGLYGSDFRAPERMAQLLIQVAGRAGRAERAGTVLVQTRHPEHPMLTALLRQGYAAFARSALREREAAALPPFGFQALLRADSLSELAPMDFLRAAERLARGLAPELSLWGPAPARMERRAGRFRAQLLLQGPQRSRLHAALDRLMPELQALKPPRGLRWSVDVDPQDSS